MGISRDSMHKRRPTGGKKKAWRKKRRYELGRQPGNTKLVPNEKTVRGIRVRGGNVKWRALRLELGTTHGEEAEAAAPTEDAKQSNHVMRKLEKRQKDRKIDQHVEEQFASGRLLAAITSRPGQCGRADGYILEGKELEFYMKKIQRKKGKSGGAA